MKYKGLVTTILILILIFSLVVTAHESDKELLVVKADGKAFYMNNELDLKNSLYFVNGRLFLPLVEFTQKIGIPSNFNSTQYEFELEDKTIVISLTNNEMLKTPLIFIKQTAYISSFDLGNLMDLWAVFDGSENKVDFYKEKKKEPALIDRTNMKEAYIRFEDITFDNCLSFNFSDENLEKLRAISNYLWQHGHYFNIAWIPIYVNPPKNIVNDITKTFSFYNADYIHTLDYLTKHNGAIVLHGLTHQEDDTISGVGTEFGAKTPYSDEEVYERMLQAKEIAETYGYNSNMFEFPHYACTPSQIEIAEQLFDVLYQPCTKVKNKNEIFNVKRENKTIKYLPTTLSYIKKEEEVSVMIDRIEQLPQNSIKSMFFHPFIDYDKIRFTVDEDGYRSYEYDKDAKLVKLLEELEARNIYFTKIDAK